MIPSSRPQPDAQTSQDAHLRRPTVTVNAQEWETVNRAVVVRDERLRELQQRLRAEIARADRAERQADITLRHTREALARQTCSVCHGSLA